MGTLSNRYWTMGGHHGGRKKGDLGPLRKIIRVIHPARDLFDQAWVELECGHIEDSNGAYRAHCSRCGDKPGS